MSDDLPQRDPDWVIDLAHPPAPPSPEVEAALVRVAASMVAVRGRVEELSAASGDAERQIAAAAAAGATEEQIAERAEITLSAARRVASGERLIPPLM